MNLPFRRKQVMPFVLAVVSLTRFATPALAQAGVAVPEDSPIFNAFRLAEKQPGYRMHMEMKSSDPRMARMMAGGMGMGPMEKVVKGGVSQASMHWKMPAMDIPGQVDDWEVKAIVKDGRGARIFSSPAAPRIMKLNDQKLAMEVAMFERQEGTALAQAMASGPFGAISASVDAAQMAMAPIMAARMNKQAHDFFEWKCVDVGGGKPAEKRTDQLTDLKSVGDEAVNGTPARAYEFYARDGGQLRGPIRFYVAKDTGLPLRLAMTDPQGHGSMNIDYEYSAVPDIEVPACLANGQ